MKVTPLMRRVAKEHGLKVVQVKSGDKYCRANGEENYLEKSYCAGSEIWLGMYKDPDLHLASFFHEIGHHLLPREYPEKVEYDRASIEAECWRLGFDLASKHKIGFSPSVHQWAAAQVDTYR